MAEYRWLLEDVMTGYVTATDLDIAKGATFSGKLNRAGQIRCQLPLRSTFATEELLSEGRTALYVERDGRIEQGGIVWDVIPSTDGMIDLTADGWLGFFDHQPIAVDRQFTATDQFEIVETLVDDMQDEAEWGTGFDLGITVAWDALSGVTRDRVEDYRPWRTKNLGEALRQLAASIDGFDMAFEYELAGDRISKTLRLYHPTKGRDTGYVPELDDTPGGNIVAVKYPRSARNMAWVGRAWGDGADESRLSSSLFVDESKRGIYPPLFDAPTFSGVTEQSTLDDHAAATFSRSKDPVRVPLLTIDPNRDPTWGDFVLGDLLRVRVDRFFIQIDAPYRFVGFDMDVDSDTPTLQVALP